MQNILEKLSKFGLVPVIKLERAEDAVPLAKALCQGGLPCAEITFRTAACIDAISAIKREVPDMLVGAGTVLTTEQADAAAAAGAEFIVSPGLNPRVVGHCVKQGLTVIPGCSCPSDIERALEFGLEAVKFFPAEASGGLPAVRAMAAPYGNLKFFPTGGIHAENLVEYLSCESVICCGGTWMVPQNLIRAGRFDEIGKLAKKAVDHMLGFQIAHVGINCQNGREAQRTADWFAQIFHFEPRENPSSIFAASSVEILKAPYLGAKGHIAIAANFPERGAFYLESRGVALNRDSAVYTENGRLQAIYLQEEVGGFAIHLVKKTL